MFERVDHRHLDDLLPALPTPCEDTAQLLGDYLGDQLVRADLPFAQLVDDVTVVDAWPDAGSRAWGLVARPLRFHAAHRLDGLPDGHKCRRQHGHGYQVGVQIDPAATGTPSSALLPAEAFIRHELHQRSLNEVLGSNPTAEQLAETLGRTSSASSRFRGWSACRSRRRPRRWRRGGQRRRGRERCHRHRSPDTTRSGGRRTDPALDPRRRHLRRHLAG